MSDCDHVVGICYAWGGDFLLELSYLELYPYYKDETCMDWFNYCPKCGEKMEERKC